jgi:D-amino peptidase
VSGPRVFISVDMEGVAGISRLENASPAHSSYARGQLLMVEEANAAVRGAFDAGASDVVVADSHGPMDNLSPELLDPRARLVNGSPRACGMMDGLDVNHDIVFLIGYHAAANSPGVLSHSFTGWWSDFRLNGVTVSEADVNTLYAASLGVPVALLTGDDRICGSPAGGMTRLRTVAVKQCLSHTSANAMSPQQARTAIYEAAKSTVSEGSWPTATVPDRLRVEADLKASAYADLVAMVPTVERVSELTVGIDCGDVGDIYRFISVAGTLAAHISLGHAQLLTGPAR